MNMAHLKIVLVPIPRMSLKNRYNNLSKIKTILQQRINVEVAIKT